jgi:hypothetical protein
MNRALEIVSRIEKLGGCLAVDKDGAIRFRLPKNNPEAKTLLEVARAEKESILAYLRANHSSEQTPGTRKLALCGSPRCAGCYDVGDGRRIHPPKVGEDYQRWLERWKPKGSLQ